MNKFFLPLLLLTCGFAYTQDVTITGKSLPPDPILSTKFDRYELFEIDVEKARLDVRSAPRSAVEIDLVLGGIVHKLQLNKYNVLKPGCKVRVATANGYVDEDPDPRIETYRGYNANFGGGEVALTFGYNYLSLMFKEGEETYYLEQAMHEFNQLGPNTCVLYGSHGYKPYGKVRCNAEMAHDLGQDKQEAVPDPNTYRNQRCWEVDIAMACDFAFANSYGGKANAEARLTAIVNLMQTDWVYPKQIADYIWGITTIFVPEAANRDPFASANSIDQLQGLLAANAPNIFFGGFDISTVWTNKFTRTPVYNAPQAGACTLNPYTACTEFVKDNAIVRSLQSHAMGHAFNAAHDGAGSPFIMAPEIVGNAQWSNPSQFTIYERAYNIRGCLIDCSGGNIPVAEFSGDPVEGCIPVVVQFTNMSSNATSYKWSFPGGTPASSTLKDPIVIYNSPGSYSVELQAINAKCSTKVEKLTYITIKDKPRGVRFIYGAANGTNEVELFAFADCADLYKWKFHDGTTDEGDYVIHTYPKEGSFEVELCASNDCGETCVKQKIDNYYIPTADFTSDTTRGCAPVTIKFFDQSTANVIAWTWSFPGGNPTGSFIKNPTVKYTRPGTYQVKLVVNSKKNNAQIVKDAYIIVDSLPLAQFDPQVAGPAVVMNNSSLYAKDHFWDFGDGTISRDSSPVHVFRDGRYTITYTATNDCGTTVTKRTVTVGNKPTAGFSVQNANGCVPYTVKFINTSTSSAQTFEWSFPGGVPSTSTDKEPTVTYNTIGQFDVKLVARSGPESDSLTQTKFITVGEGPTAGFQHSVTGFVAFFTDQSKKATNYYWDFGDGKSSTQASPNHNYGVEGEFHVRLITENECGVDTAEKDIAIYLIPKVNFTSDVIKGCAPLKVKFQDLSSIDVVDWSWQFESGTPPVSTLKNPEVSFDKAGKYTVKLTVRNSNGTNSATKLKYVEVKSPILCPRKPPKKPEGGLGDNEFNGGLSSRISESVQVDIYPNPATDEIFIEGAGGTKIQLFSLHGKMLLSRSIKQDKEKLPVSGLEPGCYLLRIDHRDYSETIRVSVIR